MDKQEKQVSTKKGKQAVRPQDEALWEALRALRLSLAEKAGVPPYVIFHDATLQEMLKVRPTNLNDMNRITGVGEQKLERFGKKFIDEIAKFPLPELLDNTLSKTVNETLMLYQQGKTIAQIIKQRELTSTTVYTHLSEAIEMGLLDVKEVLELDEQKYDEIVFAIESFGDDEERHLKPVFEALDGAYDYGLLRCVQASI